MSSPGDLERLLFSAIGVVLRRDMSLNRRLFIWLLGPESQPTYFLKYAQGPVTEALKKLLKQQGNLLPNPIRVSKISLALLDKWEIGGHIVPKIFTPLMETVFSNPEANVLGSARALFDNMDPAVIWAELFSWNEQERDDMLIWVVEKFNLREEEMLVRHIPQVLLHILCLLRQNLFQETKWFVLAQKLIRLLPSRAFTSSKGVDLGPELTDVEVTTFVRGYYGKISGNSDVSLPESIRGTYFHRHILNLLQLAGRPCSPDYTLEWTALLRDAAGIIPPLPEFNFASVLDNLHEYIRKRGGFQLVGNVIDTTIALVHHRHVNIDYFYSESEFVDSGASLPSTLVHLLWRNLDPDRAAHHVASVAYIWSLTSFLSSPTIELLIANEIDRSSHTDIDNSLACARFCVLWKHAVDRSGTAAVLTKPMMLVLRFLKGEEGSLGRMGIERWLASLGNSAHRYISQNGH